MQTGAPVNVLFLTRSAHSWQNSGLQLTRVATLGTALEYITLSPPEVFLLDAEAVGPDVLNNPNRIREVCAWTPTALFAATNELSLIHRAWPLAQLGIHFVYQDSDLRTRIESLAEAAPSGIAEMIRVRLCITDPLVIQVLDIITADNAGLVISAHDLARKLCVSRASLYAHLKLSNVPGVAELQTLAKLMRASRILLQGGTLQRATRAGLFSDPRSLRRSIETHLGLKVVELRNYRSLAAIFDRWADRRINAVTDLETTEPLT